MHRATTVSFEFVKYMPESLEEGRLYISIDFATAAHLCCCGCGQKVVTPLSPTDWELTFDRVSVSLSPSIGNWSFECQSHYWIEKNQVHWARRWARWEVEWGRFRDRRAKAAGYSAAGKRKGARSSGSKIGFIRRLWKATFGP